MNEQIKEIINYIELLCNNQSIVNHAKRIINDNLDYITELNDRCIRANRLGEVMEINISRNCFTIYSTSWNYSTRKCITFFKTDNCIALALSNCELTNEGIISNNYKYEFHNGNLVWGTYSKRVDLEYELGKELKKIKKDEYIEIYPIDTNKGLKKVKKNDKIEYYITEINEVTLNDIYLFSFIFSKMDEKVTKEKYEKIKVIK